MGELAPLLPATPAAPGLPAAPVRPSGVAAKVPRRLPCGGWGGPWTAGCKFRATTRPPVADDPDAEKDGGGGTTCGAVLDAVEMPPGMARCSPTGSCGVGEMTELCPIFRSPSWRVEEFSTLGGGAMTAGC